MRQSHDVLPLPPHGVPDARFRAGSRALFGFRLFRENFHDGGLVCQDLRALFQGLHPAYARDDENQQRGQDRREQGRQEDDAAELPNENEQEQGAEGSENVLQVSRDG